MLPKYCGSIVDLDKNIKDNRKLSMRYNVLSREQLKALSEDSSKADGAANILKKPFLLYHNHKILCTRFASV